MIGITGGIASGKSVVSERLRQHGAVVLDADVFSREVVLPHTLGWHKVKDVFPEVIQSNLTIDRPLLGQIVFADTAKRRILEGIIHPAVLDRLQDEARRARLAGKTVFADVPLLYEVGWDRFMEEVWVVFVRHDVQLERLMKRARISEDKAELMISSQWPLTRKVEKAQKVINNNGSLAETYQQVDALWKEKELQYDDDNSTNSP